MSLRRRLVLAALASGTIGVFFGYNVGGVTDQKRNEELTFAYHLHLNTVRDLITYARTHAIAPGPAELDEVVARATIHPDVRNRADFSRFETAQAVVATFARDLITKMDGELSPTDPGFAKLIRRFETEERSLDRIRRRPRVSLPSLAFRDKRP